MKCLRNGTRSRHVNFTCNCDAAHRCSRCFAVKSGSFWRAVRRSNFRQQRSYASSLQDAQQGNGKPGGGTMWEALEQTPWVKTLSETGWMYATVSVIHYLTMFWFIGSMAVVDLRVMGVAARKRNLAQLSEQIYPWAWTGLVLAIISGFFMFSTAAGDWAPDPIFHIKLALIIFSIL